jgi:hypothetical protein
MLEAALHCIVVVPAEVPPFVLTAAAAAAAAAGSPSGTVPLFEACPTKPPTGLMLPEIE